jgi:hypothetical protein
MQMALVKTGLASAIAPCQNTQTDQNDHVYRQTWRSYIPACTCTGLTEFVECVQILDVVLGLVGFLGNACVQAAPIIKKTRLALVQQDAQRSRCM